jgi:flagellar hook-basal body complex protein FliE
MKSSLNQKPCAAKTIKRFLAVLLAGAMLFGLCACAAPKPKETEEIEPFTMEVEREPGPQTLQTANEATALALRYYIYARLKTEELIAADYKSMLDGAFESLMDELVSIWETTDALTSGAEEITDQAILMLETASVSQTTAYIQPRAQVMTLAAKGSNLSAIPLADNEGETIDRQTWAENLSKQYDALRGAQRYKQLAQQLGTDTKTAVEQMALAQKIIRNAADLEETQAEVNAYTRSINIVEGYKTGSKVGLFIGATVATGGGSLTALAGSSMSAPVAGAVLVGGVDCIVDVGKTTSSIVLGEDHQVAIEFQKASDVLQPVSMVIGLATLNPNDIAGQIALVGEGMMEWFNPGKIMGIGIERAKDGGTRMIAQLVNAAEQNVPGSREVLEKALAALGISLPSEKEVELSELVLANTVDSKAALEKMRALNAQISAAAQEDENQSLPPQETDPSDEEGSNLTGEQQEAATGPITGQEMAGTYSGTAVLQFVEEDVEADDSLPVTLQLNEAGTGTVNVYGYSGEAEYAGSSVSFSVTMKGILCEFKGKATRSGSQIVLSGDMRCSMMGVTFASYTWTAQK